MAGCIFEWPTRALLPRLLLRAKRRKARSRTKARLMQALDISLTVELYFAFDDPYSAVALPALQKMTDDRALELRLYPVVKRGIEGDPDIELRRAYSLADARRLAAEEGREIARKEPLVPEDVSYLSAWAEEARDRESIQEFSVAAMDALWHLGWPPGDNEFRRIYERTVNKPPPDDVEWHAEQVRKNELRLRKKGHWDTPACLVHGQWYFAHERIEQIAERLDYLGWKHD